MSNGLGSRIGRCAAGCVLAVAGLQLGGCIEDQRGARKEPPDIYGRGSVGPESYTLLSIEYPNPEEGKLTIPNSAPQTVRVRNLYTLPITFSVVVAPNNGKFKRMPSQAEGSCVGVDPTQDITLAGSGCCVLKFAFDPWDGKSGAAGTFALVSPASGGKFAEGNLVGN